MSNPVTDALGPTDPAAVYVSDLALLANGAVAYDPDWPLGVGGTSNIYLEFALSGGMESHPSLLCRDASAYRIILDGHTTPLVFNFPPSASDPAYIQWFEIVSTPPTVFKDFLISYPGGAILNDWWGFDAACRRPWGYMQTSQLGVGLTTMTLRIERIADSALMLEVTATVGSGESGETGVCTATTYTGTQWSIANTADTPWRFRVLDGIDWIGVT